MEQCGRSFICTPYALLICGYAPMPTPMSCMICATIICGVPGQGEKVNVVGNVCWLLEDVGCFMCLLSCKRYHLGSEIGRNCWRYVLEESHYLLKGLTFLSYTLNGISKIQSCFYSFLWRSTWILRLINSISHTICMYVCDLCLCQFQVSVSSGLLVTVMKQKPKYKCICATLFCSLRKY